MDKILLKQITGQFIDLSVSDKFKNHHLQGNSYSKYIIDNEINVGLYNEPLLNSMFHNDPIVIDAGANVGLFSLYVLPKAKYIYCIEPTLSHFEVLKDVFEKIKCDKVEFHNIALNNYDGECNFDIRDLNTTENRITHEETGIKVKCLTLKSFFENNNIQRVDLLKLDIEGGEEVVLLRDTTIDDTLKKCNMIYVEAHPAPWGTIKEDELIAKMIKLNFHHKTGNRAYSHYFFK